MIGGPARECGPERKILIGRNYGNCRRTSGTGFHIEGSEPKRRKAFRLSREKCGDRVLSAGLESGVHERAYLLRQRVEAIREAECAGTGAERGQRLVAQGVCREDGHSLSVAG